MNFILFGWLTTMVGLFFGELKGRHQGYKDAHKYFCRNQAEFYRYCMKDEYLGFLKKYNIPLTKSMQKNFEKPVNVYEKHRLINQLRESCIKECEKEKGNI